MGEMTTITTHGSAAPDEHQRTLTVNHLDNATVASKPTRKLVARSDHVSRESAWQHSLVSLGGSTRRVNEVPPCVGRIDRTGIAVILRTVERVHVEATLGHNSVGIDQVVGVADE